MWIFLVKFEIKVGTENLSLTKIMIPSSDTIVALASAPQNAAVGVIRLSGPDALSLLQRIFIKNSGQTFLKFQPRYFHWGKIINRREQILDSALAVVMPCPHSFTGEDVVELHCHGNVILLKSVIALLLSFADEFAVRAAEPGEFTKRAYLNGKMDLTQAEAVHGIIMAESEATLASSLRNLDGRLKTTIDLLRDELKLALALVEASFEFADEDIQTYNPQDVLVLLTKCQSELKKLHAAFATSKLYDVGVSVAIVGRPNVGKSSLLNAVLVEDRALVTPIAGTTRDVVEGAKIINGVRFVFRDTAGLRDANDVIESFGIEKTIQWIDKSEVILHVSDSFDGDDGFWQGDLDTKQANKKIIRVLNKIDTFSEKLLEENRDDFDIALSAKTEQGLDKLGEKLCEVVNVQNAKSVQNLLHINERQHQKITGSLYILNKIIVGMGLCAHPSEKNTNLMPNEILAEELRGLIQCLGEITGIISNDEVLGEIFKRFCIGK
jgi:tRNA modification GTPase